MAKKKKQKRKSKAENKRIKANFRQRIETVMQSAHAVKLTVPGLMRQFADLIENKELREKAQKADPSNQMMKMIVQLIRSYVHGPMGCGPEVWQGQVLSPDQIKPLMEKERGKGQQGVESEVGQDQGGEQRGQDDPAQHQGRGQDVGGAERPEDGGRR